MREVDGELSGEVRVQPPAHLAAGVVPHVQGGVHGVPPWAAGRDDRLGGGRPAHLLPQRSARPGQARHDRADRHAEDGGDFLVGEFFDVGEEEDLPVLGAERVERGGDLLVLDLGGGRLLGGERLGEAGLALGAERERDLLAAPLLVHVPEDLVEPRAAVRAPLELPERLPGLEEDLGREVLGLGRAAASAAARPA